jgi:hypothetical protein
MRRLHRHVRLVPISEVAASFDYLVSSAEQRDRHSDAERFGRLEVNDQLDLGELLDWQIGRLLALENSDAGRAIMPWTGF